MDLINPIYTGIDGGYNLIKNYLETHFNGGFLIFSFEKLAIRFSNIIQTSMQQNKQKLDIINMLLEDCIMAFPVSKFVISIYQQYQRRGWLSKKQLQGLYDKASKIHGILPGRLAALESIIKKMPTREKSELPEPTPMFAKDEVAGKMIEEILNRYPQHKRVLFLKAKYDNNEVLTAADISELKKFRQVLK